VADYAHELLPCLAEAGERIDVFYHGSPPAGEDLGKWVTLHPVRDFEWRDARMPYELCLYHMGNNPLHDYMYAVMYQHPGLIVLHDTTLQQARIHACLARGDFAPFRHEFTASYGAVAAQRAPLLTAGFGHHVVYHEYPLLKPVLWANAGAIVHNQDGVTQIRREHAEIPVTVVPSPLTLPPGIDPAWDQVRAKTQLKLDPAVELAVACGLITENKGILPLLEAVARLAPTRPAFKLALAGAEHKGFPVRQYIKDMGLEQIVIVAGHVSQLEFHHWIQAADVCVNLRYPTQGETSAVLVRMLGLGRAVIIPDYRQFREIPSAAAVHVKLGPGLNQRIAAILDSLLGEPARRRHIETEARRFALAEHSMERAVAGYQRAIKDAAVRAKLIVPVVRRGIFAHASDARAALANAIAAQCAATQFREAEVLSAELSMEMGLI